jgi:hypothetical protein
MTTESLVLSAAARQAMHRLGDDLSRVFGRRSVALIAYTATRSVAFVSQIDAADLAALAPLVDRWHREGLETPLVLTPDEFHRSLDVFPIEYGAILQRHVVITGQSPLGEAAPSRDDLRRACEVQAKGFLIHLRQGWLHAADHADEQRTLLIRSAAPLRALLVNLARLSDTPAGDDAALAAFAAQHFGTRDALVTDVLALDSLADPTGRADAVRVRIDDYLAAATALWASVDAWRA